MGDKWGELLADQLEQPYFAELMQRLAVEYEAGDVCPAMEDVFAALRLTDFDDVRVVILGQDPYHGPGQAHGLAFSVRQGVAIPPSLANILRELSQDLGVAMPTCGCLTPWAQRGVLLLNTTLTVRAGQPTSHCKLGWQVLTDRIISLLDARQQPVVFLLWGNFARAKSALVTGSHHLVLEASHPSPLSVRGFRGCKHFSRANAFLTSIGQSPIDWRLPEEDFFDGDQSNNY